MKVMQMTRKMANIIDKFQNIEYLLYNVIDYQNI